jgi:hypothetical protein
VHLIGPARENEWMAPVWLEGWLLASTKFPPQPIPDYKGRLDREDTNDILEKVSTFIDVRLAPACHANLNRATIDFASKQNESLGQGS